MAVGTPYLLGTSTSGAVATPTTITPAQATGTGDAIVVVANGSSLTSAVSSVSDSQGNSYALAFSYAAAGSYAVYVYEARAAVPLATTDTITVTWSSVSGPRVTALGCAGVAAATPADPAGQVAANSPVNGTAPNSGPTGTLAQAGELAVGVILNGNGGGAVTWDSPWNSISSVHTGSTEWQGVAWQVPGSTAAVTASGTIASTNWTALVVTFEPAGSAGAGTAALSGAGTLGAGPPSQVQHAAAALSGAGVLSTALPAPAATGVPGALPGALPAPVAGLKVAPGAPPGPGGSGGGAVPAAGTGWEIWVRSYKDYSALLAVIPAKMIVSVQFAKQLNDIGSGAVQLNLDDPWWKQVTLPDSARANELLDFECLWQVYRDGACRFEFFGETVQEQLVDSSGQRLVTVTGPGTAAALKWAAAMPAGFPSIVLKLDAIADSFSEIDTAGNPVLDTNTWNQVSPAGSVFLTPVAPLFPTLSGAPSPSQLYPSGTLTLQATSGTTYVGATPYDATDTLVSAQIVPIGAANRPTDSNGNAVAYGSNLNGSELTQLYVQSLKNSNYYALFGLSGTSFYCQAKGPAGTSTHVISTAGAYDPEQYAYWMITEQNGSGGGSGTFYFWTSSDGSSWVLQWQVVHTWDATDCGFYVTSTYNGTGQSVVLSNLNGNVTTPSYQGNVFLGLPAMGIWRTLLQAAQARGTVPFVTTSLTASGDSYGRAWPDVQNVQVTNGTNLFDLLQSFCATINADFCMQPGFLLQVGLTQQGSVSLGADRSGTVIFREGAGVVSKQRTRTRTSIANLYGAENADGHEISSQDSTSIASWGQREGWFQTSAQVDPVSMQIAAAAAAADAASEQVSYTLAILPGLPGRQVFSSFDVGDWVGLERPDFSAVDAVRVTAIAVSVDSAGAETHELTIETYLSYVEAQLTYLANKLGGQFVQALGTSPVAPSRYGTGQVPTWFAPAATLRNLADVVGSPGHNAAPLVYNAATGQWQAAGTADPATGQQVGVSVPSGSGTVVISGGTVTATAAGTPVVAPEGGGPQPPSAAHVISPTVQQITDATGTVRTIVGKQADGGYTSVDVNGPAHAAPDTPSVTGTLNGLLITWDGLVGGAAPPSDFLWAEVHVSTASGFTPSAATLKGTLVSAATFPLTGLVVGTAYYVKLLERNTSGVASPASVQASAVPTALTAALIGPLGVLNGNPYFSGADSTGWAGVSGTLAVTASPPAGAPYPDAAQFTVITAGVGAAAKESAAGGPFRVAAGTQYLLTAWVYTPTTTAVLGFDWQNSASTFLSSSTQSFAVTANTWTLVTAVQASPAGAAWAVPRVAPADGAGNSIWFTAALALPQVPGSLVQAGTITAAQIAAHTITASQIVSGTITTAEIAASTITGGNIAANTITASNITAGTITAGLLAANIVVAGIVNGTTITGATIVADGASGELLIYSGVPASGNLIGSWSGASGVDASGNSYPAGLAVETGGLVLYNQASAATAVSGATVLYGSTAGRLRMVKSSGADDVLERGSVNVGVFSVGNTTTAGAVSATMAYKAADAAQSTTYEIEIAGTIQVGTTAETLTLKLYVDGANIGGQGGGFVIGAAPLNITGGGWSFRVTFTLAVLTTGTSGVALVSSHGALADNSGTNLQTSTMLSPAGGGGLAGAAFDTTADHNLWIAAFWGGAGGSAQKIQTTWTRFTRYM